MDQKLEQFVALLRRPGPQGAPPVPPPAKPTQQRRSPPKLAPRRRWAWPRLPMLRRSKPAPPAKAAAPKRPTRPGRARLWINLGSAGAALAVIGVAVWLALPERPAPAPVAEAAAPVALSRIPAPIQVAHLPIPMPSPAPEEQGEMTAPDPDAAAEPPPAPPPGKPPTPGVQLAALPPPKLPPARLGEPAWLRFAVPAPAAQGRPRIAIVIDDLGLDRKRTERAIALKGPLTLSFLAYANDLPRLTEEAHRAGHELMVHVPMEPMSHSEDMGPNGLAVGLGRDEVLRRLRWDLDRFEGYVGINNHMGSRFTSDAQSMTPVIEELKARGLLFLDSRTIGSSTGLELARKFGVPSVGRDVFLDNEVSPRPIAERLAEVEQIARRHGSAIAIGHPHDATLDQLTPWLASLPAKGFVLVPVSAIVKEHAVLAGGAG